MQGLAERIRFALRRASVRGCCRLPQDEGRRRAGVVDDLCLLHPFAPTVKLCAGLRAAHFQHRQCMDSPSAA